MRTTLNIDDDVLAAAKERARREGRTVSDVVSDAVRIALTASLAVRELPERNGFPQLPRRGAVVTNEMVDRIRDAIGV